MNYSLHIAYDIPTGETTQDFYKGTWTQIVTAIQGTLLSIGVVIRPEQIEELRRHLFREETRGVHFKLGQPTAPSPSYRNRSSTWIWTAPGRL
jgi:hypothetical protein